MSSDSGEERAEEGNGEKRMSLDTALSTLLEETRILLPGTQTLFGFQLIVGFNQAFLEQLTRNERDLHLVATILTLVAVALFMTPAALRRQVERETVSRRFLHLASRLLSIGTVPLALAICMEAYLVAQVITQNTGASTAVAVFAVLVFGSLWYILPRIYRNDQPEPAS